MNYLYLGDCLYVLRDNVPDESVDLIYIDPPFNSKRDYNIFFDDKEIQTQRIAFEDTWSLKNIQDSLFDLHTLETDNIYKLLMAYQEVAPHAFPYLVMMSLRILELHRVLKPTGSFYLHCDPTMSHYLKTICDLIFGQKNFLTEVIWCYRERGISKRYWNKKHDTILFYAKDQENHTFNYQNVLENYSAEYLKKFKYEDKTGKYQIRGKNIKGSPVQRADGLTPDAEKKYPNLTYRQYIQDGMLPVDWWFIPLLNKSANERLGYPTQKPKSLLERIIKASSNEGDIVLDAFCGCGTTVDAAEELNRYWVGIDISPVALSLIQRRLRDTYGDHLNKYEIRGVPVDENSAIELWKANPNAFQDWWLTELEVFSTTFGTKGSDKGVDGIGQYLVTTDGQTIRAAFQVKGGAKVESKDIDALLGAMKKHKCELGVFLTITNPTKPMMDTVAGEGFYEAPGKKFPRLQILTLEDYFKGKKLKLPAVNITFKAAERKGKKKHNQLGLDL